MKVGSGFGGGWLTDVEAGARRAEDLGYDFANVAETSHDSMLASMLAANATERLEIATSVTIAFPRVPMVLAMQAWDIQHLSKGRFSPRPRQPGEGPQPAPLQRALGAARPPHEGLHPNPQGHLEHVPDR